MPHRTPFHKVSSAISRRDLIHITRAFLCVHLYLTHVIVALASFTKEFCLEARDITRKLCALGNGGGKCSWKLPGSSTTPHCLAPVQAWMWAPAKLSRFTDRITLQASSGPWAICCQHLSYVMQVKCRFYGTVLKKVSLWWLMQRAS